MSVRLVKPEELEQVNALRKQVYDLHAQGDPEVFHGFSQEIRNHVYTIWNDPMQEIVVCEREGAIAGYAALHHCHMPDSPFMKERDYLDIEEFCVDEPWRNKGVGKELMNYIRIYASERNIHRIELSVWSFNASALRFYESIGFKTYRRYMCLT